MVVGFMYWKACTLLSSAAVALLPHNSFEIDRTFTWTAAFSSNVRCVSLVLLVQAALLALLLSMELCQPGLLS